MLLLLLLFFLGLFKIDENYTVDKDIININGPAVRGINQCSKSTM